MKLLRQILDNPADTFFLSSREMAKRYDVDAATIVRTIQALGYAKFAAFAADLRSHFITRITPYSLLKAASPRKTDPDGPYSEQPGVGPAKLTGLASHARMPNGSWRFPNW